jgi:hypothetical protein
VDYATADRTTTNGLKYMAVSGRLAFGASETNKTIVVPILNEGFVEGTETFQVFFSNRTVGALLGYHALYELRARRRSRIVDRQWCHAFPCSLPGVYTPDHRLAACPCQTMNAASTNLIKPHL